MEQEIQEFEEVVSLKSRPEL